MSQILNVKRIIVSYEVSSASGKTSFSFDDLDTTEEQWNKMLTSEKESLLQDAIDGIEQPSWIVEDYDIINK